jgi:hypothetical protein
MPERSRRSWLVNGSLGWPPCGLQQVGRMRRRGSRRRPGPHAALEAVKPERPSHQHTIQATLEAHDHAILRVHASAAAFPVLREQTSALGPAPPPAAHVFEGGKGAGRRCRRTRPAARPGATWVHR